MPFASRARRASACEKIHHFYLFRNLQVAALALREPGLRAVHAAGRARERAESDPASDDELDSTGAAGNAQQG